MNRILYFSRRKAIWSLAATIVIPCPEGSPLARDADLIALGREFDCVAAELDRCIDNGLEIDAALMEKFDTVEAGILGKEATTIEGLRVKARAACWALLGDFEARDQGETLSARMAMSIIQDLIRAFAPQLERPGALKRLVSESLPSV